MTSLENDPDTLVEMIRSGDKEAADAALAKQGFKLRYSDAVFCADAGAGRTRPCPVAAAYTGVLPESVIGALQRFLRPDEGGYFSEHDYFSGKAGYFSYAHDLKMPDGTLIEQAANLIREAMVKDFPDLRQCGYVEWWAHSRSHERGHQLHWDSDAEGLNGLRHPIVSSIIYLSENIGGATLITEQKLGDPIAEHGWMVAPRQVGMVGAFEGNVLHSVIGGAGASGDDDEEEKKGKRTTLMIAFWRTLKMRPSISQTPGACRPLPYAKWVDEISSPAKIGKSDMPSICKLELDYVEPFFQRIGDQGVEMPKYEEIFQGL